MDSAKRRGGGRGDATPSTSQESKPHPITYSLPAEREHELKALYRQLDVGGDGTIDIRDLTTALRKRHPNLRDPSSTAHFIFKQADQRRDKRISFGEFVDYILEHEKNLKVTFDKVDRNNDGKVDVKEVRNFLNDLGMDPSIAEDMVCAMDKNKSNTIELEEWIEHLRFFPGHLMQQISAAWTHEGAIDIGEDIGVPEDFSQSDFSSGVWWRHLVAGAVAGAVSRTSTAPLDRLKVFLQVHANGANALKMKSGMRFLLNEGGFKSLWRGNGMNCVKIAPEMGLKFMAYEEVKRLMRRDESTELTLIQRFCAGSTAGLISQSAIYPLEVLKTRLALRSTGELDKGFMTFVLNMYRSGGVNAFYRGYCPNAVGIIPYAGIDLMTYEMLKRFWMKRERRSEPGVLIPLACGAVSSTVSQAFSYPFALIRTRMQAQGMGCPVGVAGASASVRGALHLQFAGVAEIAAAPQTMGGHARTIWASEGPLGFYRGIMPNFVKVLPAVCISYAVYESARKQLGASMS